MYLNWREVNWFSKLLWVGLLIVLGGIAFLIGQAYQQTQDQINESVKIATPSLGQKTSPASADQQTIPAVWQTYRSEQYGFQIQYPPTWGIKSDQNGVYFAQTNLGAEDQALSVTVSRGHKNETLQSIYPSIHFSSECHIDTLGGQQAFVCAPIASFAGEKRILLKKDDLIFDVYDFLQEPITNQILKSFQFIFTTDSWQTYTNSQYGFEFSYPQWGDSPRVIPAAFPRTGIAEIDLEYRPFPPSAEYPYSSSDVFVVVNNPKYPSLKDWLTAQDGGDVNSLVENGNFEFTSIPGGTLARFRNDVPYPKNFNGPPFVGYNAFAMPLDSKLIILISTELESYYTPDFQKTLDSFKFLK